MPVNFEKNGHVGNLLLKMVLIHKKHRIYICRLNKQKIDVSSEKVGCPDIL